MVMAFTAVIFLAALYYTLSPLREGKTAWLDRENPADKHLSALETQKRIYLKALKDIEFEHATGKINDGDYTDLRGHYRREVSGILEEIEGLGDGNMGKPAEIDHVDDDPPPDDSGGIENSGGPDQIDDFDDDYDEGPEDEDEEEYFAPIKTGNREREIRLIWNRKGVILSLAGISLALVGFLFFSGSSKRAGNTNPPASAGYGNTPAAVTPPTETGLKQLIEYVQKNPWNVMALSTLGGYYMDHDKPMKALGLFERAEQNSPENISVLDQLGLLYRKIGDVDRAVEKLEKAHKIAPDNPEPTLHLGQIYLNEKNDSAKALILFREVLAKDPDGDMGKAAAVEIKKLGG
ncbi:MAG TPA: tetratricopeptide repeat protein [Proteobacteria bacterium]|nr:tetratricopeptide repeat protein [bacterium BMS3Abin14]HDL53066.1 tetratricopeptide repeat protein [Pseudomonadota bacterium]